ncbi:kinase-like domain-containing protein [Fusarium redolens]|uniref:Kinase-like domain-containing protein n=1 Tax=Fusarium redolens TaxID=48865 RepID=A0A9P9HW86_FUSRE|nr:kinase-like domain-containing protein [Fusarium redolens]KAH7264790.1 kinase-like domain-containing protein [Fusarium redolens]
MLSPLEYDSDPWTDTDSEINSDDLTDICSNDGSNDGSDGDSDDDSDDGSELDRDVFGPLVDISEESILALATRIAKDVLHVLPGNAELLKTVSGSYNIVHIVQLETVKLVIRIPATGWGYGMTKAAADALASQVTTMRFIKEQTGAPVPEVYSWDPTNNNEIGAPFICMSFVTGETVSSVWFKDSMDAEAREQFRLNILTSIAAIMAKFSSMTFDKIGSLMQAEDGSIFVGPVFEWDEKDDGSVHAKAGRTYFSTDEFMACSMEPATRDNVWGYAEAKVLKILLENSPLLHSHSHFVLCPPDFDSQNVLVDEEGKVTGFIDWDHCQTVPRHLGYAAYPGWITRDWDPLMYGWPHMPGFEDSPDDLQRYRAHYNKEMCKELSGQGDCALTKDSHIAEAVFIAAFSSMSRLEICRKFVEVALNLHKEDSLGVLLEIGEGEFDKEDWEDLEYKLKALVCPPVTPSREG